MVSPLHHSAGISRWQQLISIQCRMILGQQQKDEFGNSSSCLGIPWCLPTCHGRFPDTVTRGPFTYSTPIYPQGKIIGRPVRLLSPYLPMETIVINPLARLKLQPFRCGPSCCGTALLFCTLDEVLKIAAMARHFFFSFFFAAPSVT